MNALRRDLFERRLWPLAALLLVAVVAVPLVMLGHASTDSAGVATPPHISLPPLTTSTSASTKAPTFVLGKPRNPFASDTPKLSATPAAPLSSSTAGSSATSSTTSTASTTTTTTTPASTATTTTATTPTTVTPAPTATTSSASSTDGSGSATTSANAATGDASQVQSSASSHSWTIYSVELRAGANSNAAVRDNVARLTPLPSSAQPEVMFMGVLAGGHKAVFALSSGVGHQGQGDCRPHRQMCSELLLGAGQTEQLTFTNAAGAKQRLTLRVVAVHSTVTHSHATAVAAYERHSAAGQCELDLAAPMAYSQSQGTLSAAASTTCKGQSGAVAFPSVAKGQ